MLLIIIFVALLALGITLYMLYARSPRFSFWDHDAWLYIGITGTLLGAIGTLVCSFACLDVQVNKDIEYQEALYEREVLVFRLEHREENVIGNEKLYSDVVEFNNDLRVTKKWADNPWVGCFHNDLIAELDYIEIEEVSADG